MRGIIFTLADQRDRIVNEQIAQHLEVMGHEVDVHNYIHAARHSVPYMKPHFVVHPMIGGQFKLDFVKKCHEWGICNIVRRGEAGMTRDSLMEASEARRGIVLGNFDYNEYVDMELVWGTNFGNILINERKIAHGKVHACGPFAFDIYCHGRTKRKNDGLRAVLFATGFSGGEEALPSPECGIGEDHPYQEALKKAAREGRDKWIKAIKLIADCSAWKIFIKVRPGERTDEYLKAFGKHPVVTVLPAAYPAHEALKKVDLVVHTGSTLAIEAHLLNIPSINFHNMNPDKMVRSLAPQYEKINDFLMALPDIDLSQSNIIGRPYRELVEKLYDRIDGHATARAAQYIDTEVSMRQFPPEDERKALIPDIWPKEVMYPTDTVSPEPDEAFPLTMLCICCHNKFYTNQVPKKGRLFQKCPFCGMTIEMLKRMELHKDGDKQSDRRTNRRDQVKGGEDKRQRPDNGTVRTPVAQRGSTGNSKKDSGTH